MIGSEYQSAAIQAVLGAGHSDVIPDVLWGAWLDDTLTVLATTGNFVPHESFEPVAGGVANTVTVDAGAAPESVGDVAYFALLDASDDGEIVAYAPVAFDESPSEGDPLAFEPGELVFLYAGYTGS